MVEVTCNIPVTVEQRVHPVEPTGVWRLPACEPDAIAAAFRERFGTTCSYAAQVRGDRVHVGPAAISIGGECALARTELDEPLDVLLGERYLHEQAPALKRAGVELDFRGNPETRTRFSDAGTSTRDLLESLLLEEPDGRRMTWKVRHQEIPGLSEHLYVNVTHAGGGYLGNDFEGGPYHWKSRWWDTDAPRFQENTPEEKAALDELDRAFRNGEITIQLWRERREVLLARTRLQVGEDFPGQAAIDANNPLE